MSGRAPGPYSPNDHLKPLGIVLVGAKGRMGNAIIAAAANDPALRLVASLGRDDPLAPGLADGDVVIDFSLAEATEAVCRACAEAGRPLVLGTTGLNAAQSESVAAAARKIPLVFAPNFSIGVNVLFALTRRAADLLGKDFDPEIIEMHHRGKKDSPSGTAKRLAEILSEKFGPIEPVSVRAGDIVGEHTVVFAGIGERLELTHRAGSRATFAQGALRAARWLVAQPPGLYGMEDVLGL